MESTIIRVGDVISFGNDPQLWRVDEVMDGDIPAFRLVAIEPTGIETRLDFGGIN